MQPLLRYREYSVRYVMSLLTTILVTSSKGGIYKRGFPQSSTAGEWICKNNSRS